MQVESNYPLVNNDESVALNPSRHGKQNCQCLTSLRDSHYKLKEWLDKQSPEYDTNKQSELGGHAVIVFLSAQVLNKSYRSKLFGLC